MVIKYKASDLISDFNLNAKNTLAQLSEMFGTEIKKSTILTEEQANAAFELYTKQSKTDDFANYLSPKAEKENKTEKPADKKADKPADKKEKSAAAKPAKENKKQPAKAKQPVKQPAAAKPLWKLPKSQNRRLKSRNR